MKFNAYSGITSIERHAFAAYVGNTASNIYSPSAGINGAFCIVCTLVTELTFAPAHHSCNEFSKLNSIFSFDGSVFASVLLLSLTPSLENPISSREKLDKTYI